MTWWKLEKGCMKETKESKRKKTQKQKRLKISFSDAAKTSRFQAMKSPSIYLKLAII